MILKQMLIAFSRSQLMMPLYVSGKQLTRVPQDIVKFLSTHSEIKKLTEELKAIPSQEIGEEGVLYVGQREFAAVKPDTANIDILGTDDATTCHIILVKHTGSGVLCLAHLDGCETEKAICDMVTKTKELSIGGPEGRLEVHLIGGFKDDRGTSRRLTTDIFYVLIHLLDPLHLMTSCVSDVNDTVRQGVHYPIIYGIAVRIRTGEIFPSTFSRKGPDADIRSAANFAVNDEVIDIFRDGLLTIGPFYWFPVPELLRYIDASDQVIRKALSTSPEQEPPYFEEHIRQSLRILRDHPQPQKSLFPEFRSRVYRKNDMKLWTPIKN